MFKRYFFICLLLIVGITSNAVAQTTYIHTNAQGSVIAKSDTSGNITARYHYQPFGKRLESSDFSGTGFTGHQRDNDLGLTYMQARYYDETLGRFYSNDPVGYTAKNPVMSFNRYLYVNNNPYKYCDPDGNFFIVLAFPSIAEGLVAAGTFLSGVVAISSKSDTEDMMKSLDGLAGDGDHSSSIDGLIGDLKSGKEPVPGVEGERGAVLGAKEDADSDWDAIKNSPGAVEKDPNNIGLADGSSANRHSSTRPYPGGLPAGTDTIKIYRPGQTAPEFTARYPGN